ncbi:hypothetical protein BJY52DRAFT_1392951 [Lactarius psammicola]|nr:hypothetical protein BJY52DRAFT_1392951 [Lactarius psammicola]
MTTWREFQFEHAKFPFPQPVEDMYVSTTEATLLDGEWKDQVLSNRKHLFACVWEIRLGRAPLWYPQCFIGQLAFIASVLDVCGIVTEAHIEGCRSNVDYVVSVVGNLLPLHGFKLKWLRDQSHIEDSPEGGFIPGSEEDGMAFPYVSQLPDRLSSCQIRGGDNPFLAYSPKFGIENSSAPFRAFLASGAVLSMQENVTVQASVFNPGLELDIIPEDEAKGPLPEDKIDDGSGAYRDSSGTSTSPEIASSSPHIPEHFQVWNGNGKRRLWLTGLIGFGSTGNVWQCYFENGNSSFAIKVVELLRRSDVERRRRFCNELDFYLTLEMAYQSRVDALILELCGDTLKGWDELNISERTQLYGLVRNLHRVGIVHGDLEPRNIARVPGGGFRLFDSSESRRHTCAEISDRSRCLLAVPRSTLRQANANVTKSQVDPAVDE